jgi:hypothetical protein
MTWTMAKLRMENLQIHNSEWAWVGQKFDGEIDNNGTIDDLCEQIKSLVQDLPVAKANSGG